MSVLNSNVSQLLQRPTINRNNGVAHISTPNGDDDGLVNKIWTAYKARLCSKCRHPAVWHANGPCTCGCVRPKQQHKKKGRELQDLYDMEAGQ